MVEMVRDVVGVLVVASFATIAAFVLVTLAVAASTLLHAERRDPSDDELDRFLTELLGPRTPEALAAPDRERAARS